MTEYLYDYHIKRDHPNWKTLGDLINERYSDFETIGGAATMDMDITHGVEIETFEPDKRTTRVCIHPFIKWTDGSYNPCHYWGNEYYIRLKKC